ncbi:hypothetical protein Goarm_004104, partial [Gossypium armourianum]|nr:hypothetical protein [Gossypium armourianum]
MRSVYVEEVFYEVTFRRYTGNLTANYSDKFHKDTMWCVGMGGCFIPHMFIEEHSQREHYSVETTSPGGMKFNVAGVVIEVEAGCGGILRDDKEVAYAMFFGMIEVSGLGMAEEEPQKQ